MTNITNDQWFVSWSHWLANRWTTFSLSVRVSGSLPASPYFYMSATNVLPLIPPTPTDLLRLSALQPNKGAFQRIRADFHRDRTCLCTGLTPGCQAARHSSTAVLQHTRPAAPGPNSLKLKTRAAACNVNYWIRAAC